MKLRFFLAAGLTLLLFTCQTMQGQVHLGLKAGMNLETQSELGQLWNNNEIRAGFLVGGSVEYFLTDRISVQTELNLLQKGEEHSTSNNGVRSNVKSEFDYLTVPLFIKANFNDELGLTPEWNIYGFTGPYYSYLVSAKCKTTTKGSTSEIDITDGSVKNDWGLVFGGGVSHNLTNGNALFAELRYDMGLFEINTDNSDLRNKAINLSIGYRF